MPFPFRARPSTRLTTALSLAALVLAGCDDGLAAPRPDPIERRVEVGGYRLRIHDQGAGGPAVVLLAGLGEPLETWRTVPGAIAGFARVVSYDRAGVGESESSGGPRSADDIADELHALLAAADVPGPYVLVAHSLGGLAMQRYAQRHPGRVAGLVFVDATPEASLLELAEALPAGTDVAAFLAAVADEQGLTGDTRAEFLASVTSAAQVRDAGRLPDVPTWILTSMRVEEGGSAEERQAWFAMHAAWAAQMSDVTHVGVPDAGHHIHWDRPALVIDAVRALVHAQR